MSTKYEYHNTGDDTVIDIYGPYWRGQTFKSPTAHTITSIKALLYRLGSPRTVTAHIRATDGAGKPTGSDLCSGTIDGNTLTTDLAGLWYEITLGAGAALSANTEYAVFLDDSGGDASNHLHWRLDTDNGYANGVNTWSTDSGVNWTVYATYDLMFEEWGDPLGFTISPSSIVQPISIGTPALLFPYTLLPSSIIQPIAYGTPWVRIKRLLAPTRVDDATRVQDATRIASKTREVPL